MAFVVDEKIGTFTIEKWLGVNESPDGDVNLKPGEGAAMRNWRVTRDGNLRVRPGRKLLATISADKPIRALWSGYVDEILRLIAVCNGHAYSIASDWTVTDLGTLTDDVTTVFGFGGNVYFINGHEYMKWDGTTFAEVSGYVPVITTATPPDGGGTNYEPINLLTGSKIQWFSPVGTASDVFQLAETDIDRVDEVYDNGNLLTATTDYTVNKTAGTVTLTPSVSGVPNSVVIQYTKTDSTLRPMIEAMKYAELFGGINDCRVFFYGDGSNKAFYSAIDVNGVYNAEYIPATYEMQVGSSNTPITGMAKQYDRLLVLKTDSAWYVEAYGTITGADGSVITSFTVLPLNDAIGNEAPGQIRLIENNPVSLCRRAAYEWKSTQVRDERMAKRISDRVRNTFAGFNLSAALAFENDRDREHWIVCGSDIIVHNYEADAWYTFTNMPVTALAYHDGNVILGLSDGTICDYSQDYRSDCGVAINAYWRGGSYSLGYPKENKSVNYLFIQLRPESDAAVSISVLTNNKTSTPQKKTVFYKLITFIQANFADWSFRTGRRPQTKRVRMKLKNFTYFTPILESNSENQTANVLSLSMSVRIGGEVKTR